MSNANVRILRDGFTVDQNNPVRLLHRKSTVKLTEETMEERRKVQRLRTLKGGTITFNHAGGIDCRVRNLSPAGACLEVASQVGIPGEFVLVIEHDHLRQPCQVIWRTATRLGVEFRAQGTAA
jgi:hypothetical protein